MSGIILRIGYSVCSLWTAVCAPDVWGELVPSKILNPSSLTLKVKHLVAILYIYIFFLGIPLFFYQIVSTHIFFQFCTFIIFYFPEYIFFYSPFFTTQFFLGFSTVFLTVFLLFFYCGYLCLVCVNVNNKG